MAVADDRRGWCGCMYWSCWSGLRCAVDSAVDDLEEVAEALLGAAGDDDAEEGGVLAVVDVEPEFFRSRKTCRFWRSNLRWIWLALSRW